MVNQLLGVLTIAVTASLYALAVRRYAQRRPIASLVCILMAGFALRLYTGSDLALHVWDERYHALVSKHLIDHPLLPTLYDVPLRPYDYRDWLHNHVWLHKPPLALWTLALSMRLFGVNEIALRIPSIVLSTAAIALTWQLGRRLFGDAVALLAAFFHSSNGLLIELAAGRRATDHVDTLLIVLIEAGVVLAARPKAHRTVPHLAGIGVLTGLALLTKSLPALLIPAVWTIFAVSRWRAPATGVAEAGPVHTTGPGARAFSPSVTAAGRIALGLLVIVGTAVLVALPWTAYTYLRFPQEASWEQAYALRHVTERLESAPTAPWYFLMSSPRYLGELVFVPLAWFVWTIARGRARPEWAAIATYALLPFVVFSVPVTKLPAYVMIGAPGIFLMEAAFCVSLAASWRREKGAARWPAVVAAIVVALSVKYAFEAIRPFSARDRNPPWAQRLRALNVTIGPVRAVVFNTTLPIETMFYTPYPAYEGLPVGAEIRDLHRIGYEIVVCRADDLPPDVVADATMKKVEC